MEMDFQRRQAGFSLMELVLVLIIICILMTLMARRFADTGADAQGLAVKLMANNLAAAVGLVHRQWLAQDKKQALLNQTGFGKSDVDMSEQGWPVGRDGNLAAMMTTKICIELWQALLQPAVSGREKFDENNDYLVEVKKDLHASGGDDCVYIYRFAPEHYIRYDADRGEVSLQ